LINNRLQLNNLLVYLECYWASLETDAVRFFTCGDLMILSLLCYC